jgi:hypothetical protein
MAKGCYHYKDMFLMNWEHMKYLLDKLGRTWTDALQTKIQMFGKIQSHQ